MNDRHPASSDVLWACVEEGFHVGSRAGDFLGYIDRQADGRYRAFDARSRSLGDFDTLEQATATVSAPAKTSTGDGGSDGELRGAVR